VLRAQLQSAAQEAVGMMGALRLADSPLASVDQVFTSLLGAGSLDEAKGTMRTNALVAHLRSARTSQLGNHKDFAAWQQSRQVAFTRIVDEAESMQLLGAARLRLHAQLVGLIVDPPRRRCSLQVR
jgi:hypothetical protein